MSNGADDKFIRIQAPLKELNDNEKSYVADVTSIKGASQVFNTVDELIAFHPNKMKFGMEITIINFPKINATAKYRLIVNPEDLINLDKTSILTLNNWSRYFEQIDILNETDQIVEYAPSLEDGSPPTFPYTLASEATAEWDTEYDATKAHKWYRLRTDDVDTNGDGIYDNWSPPIGLRNSFEKGDFVENRFKRAAISDTIFSFDTGDAPTGLISTKYYRVREGKVTQNSEDYVKGKIFQYDGSPLTFLNGTKLRETLNPPPKTDDNGDLNNFPTGWTDSIPDQTDPETPLFMIEGLKDVYSNLKSNWRIKRLKEDPNYIRYSNKPTPHPNTIVSTATSAVKGSQGDTDLIAAGWANTFANQVFIAYREDDGLGGYTTWNIDKILDESGEYLDTVFKLFDSTLQVGDSRLVKPTRANPVEEGFSDTPLTETDTKINFYSTAWKYFNGELKSDWSELLPNSPRLSYLLTIESDLGDDFRYNPNSNTPEVPTPSQITLTAKLTQNTVKLWKRPNVVLSYKWERIYNNESTNVTLADADSNKGFYYLDTNEPAPTIINDTITDDPYYETGQRLVVTSDGVDGKAIFRCTVTVTLEDDDDLEIIQEYSIIDITDGRDGIDLSLKAETPLVVYDSVALSFSPAITQLSYFLSNLNSDFYWYKWDGASWAKLGQAGTGSLGGGYTATANSLTVATDVIFAGNGNAQEQRFAISTLDGIGNDPTDADFETSFSDYITVVKLGSAGVGSAGENSVIGFLENESINTYIDPATDLPQVGETSGGTANQGRIFTTLKVYDGRTLLSYNSDYTVSIVSDTTDVTFGIKAVTDGAVDNALVYLNTWTNTNARNARCTLNITYTAESISFAKEFYITGISDAPGAIILDIDSDKGYIFDLADFAPKTLTANIFDTNEIVQDQSAQYYFAWEIIGGTTTSTGILGDNTIEISINDIESGQDIKVYASKDAGTLLSNPLRTRIVRITDVTDYLKVTMYTDKNLDSYTTSANVRLPASYAPLDDLATDSYALTGTDAGNFTWYNPRNSFWESNDPIYAIDGKPKLSTAVIDQNKITTASFEWGPPRRIAGEAGAQGNTPQKGIDYFDGNNGAAATVTVGTTTTLSAGSAATVSQRGTSQDRILDFGIPRGETGIIGPTGIKGDKGDKGDTGPQGPQGPAGADGLINGADQIWAAGLQSTYGSNGANIPISMTSYGYDTSIVVPLGSAVTGAVLIRASIQQNPATNKLEAWITSNSTGNPATSPHRLYANWRAASGDVDGDGNVSTIEVRTTLLAQTHIYLLINKIGAVTISNATLTVIKLN